LWFGMHEGEQGKTKNLIDQNTYPLQDIVNSFNSVYFTNTISYMIAYALFKGVDILELYGIDMNGTREYISERGSVMYWIGRAESLGVQVKLASEIDKPCFLYGYESSATLKLKIDNMIQWAIFERDGTEDQRHKDQYTGFILGLNTLLKEL